MEPVSQLCERAQAWASLRADGELSELEAALLDGHLGRCTRCGELARGLESVAGALRAARLVRPAPLTLALPRRRRRGLRAAVAAVGIAGAAMGAFLVAPSDEQASVKPVAMVAVAESPDGLRALRRPLLIERRNTRRDVAV